MSDAFDRGITVADSAATINRVDVHTHTVAAFVGRALRGPLNTPVSVRSFAEFSKRFGGLWARSSLGPAVQHFFEHGGKRLCIVRVANGARGAVLRLPTDEGLLTLFAVEPGSSETIRVSVDYDRVSADDAEHFNLTVQRIAPDNAFIIDQEIHERLSCSEDSTRYVVRVLSESSLVRAEPPTSSDRPRPSIGPHVDQGDGYVMPSQRGDDGDDLSDYDLIGSAREQSGMFALEGIERFDILYMPPTGRGTDLSPIALMAADLFCRRRGAMLVVDPPAAWSSVEDALKGVGDSGFASSNMLSYFPRIVDRDNPTAPRRVAGGVLAGLLCKLDDQVGPWCDTDRANSALKRRHQPALNVTGDEETQLVHAGLNVIALSKGGRATLRGSVTLARHSSRDRQFASLTVRRLCLHISNTIGRVSRWAVFQAGDSRTPDRLRAQIHAFLEGLHEEGAFADDRFEVQCDMGLHAESPDPLRGVTIITAFVPAGSDELVWLTLHQTAQGFRVSSTAFTPALVNTGRPPAIPAPRPR